MEHKLAVEPGGRFESSTLHESRDELGSRREGTRMALTVAKLSGIVEALAETVDTHVTNLNEQIAALEERLDEIEESGDKRKTRGRNMTPEQRQEAGRRLQQARADKLGLETIEQLHALHLRPGTKPTKKQIAAVLKEFPAEGDGEFDEEENEEDDDE